MASVSAAIVETSSQATVAISIAIFLATMAVLLPHLTVQAARGTRSQFNVETPFDSAAWVVMVVGIVAASAVMMWLAVVASSRLMSLASGKALPALMTTAWRAGLWLLMLAPVSGFAMGSRLQHSVGGAGPSSCCRSSPSSWQRQPRAPSCRPLPGAR